MVGEEFEKRLRATEAAVPWDREPKTHREDRPSGRVHQSTRVGRQNLADLDFQTRLAAVGIPHLITPDPPIEHRGETATGFMVHLATLQRMDLHYLQEKLLKVVKEIVDKKEGDDMPMFRARRLLTDYANAIRDYDFMTEKEIESRRNNTRDPFEITTRDPMSFYLMKDGEMIPPSTSQHPVKVDRPKDHMRFQGGYVYNILPGSSRGNYNARIDLGHFWERITMGLLGGIAFIAPMLMMVLHQDLLTTLITVSASTILFAAALSFFTQLQGEKVLASVAAYAAVLVVFVGEFLKNN